MLCDHPRTVVSLFDGIGGFPLAFASAGAETVATVEIDKAAAGVAADHFPNAKHFADVTEVTVDDILATGFCPVCGVICAGWPCQDLSLAGRRLGLGGARSGLFFEIVRLARGLRPRWLVLENVPGLLSAVCSCPGLGVCGARGCADPHPVPGGSCGIRGRGSRRRGRCMELHGGAMGAVLGALAELGYGFAYRVLDAQHFGVPQRRRRVVIVGCLGDWAAPSAVLLEPEGGAGDSAQSGPARASVTGAAASGAGDAGVLDVAPTLQGGGKRGYRVDAETPAGGAMRKGNGNVTGGVPFVAQPLTAREGKGPDSDTTSGTPLVPMAFGHTNGLDVQASESVTPTLRAGHDVGGGSVMTPATDSVRRLTPVECERLQGYPDGWTATSIGRPQADSARYRQLGNSIAVPMFAWVARRLTAYED
jgi:DNA (cytosine-5)-methyltransferase 1